MAAGPGPGPEPTMVCRCGKSLSLKGAAPGRVGRCPQCGATFQVPEAPRSRPPAGRLAPASAPAPDLESPIDLDAPAPDDPWPGPTAGPSTARAEAIPLDAGPSPSVRPADALDPDLLAGLGPGFEPEDEWNPAPGGYDLAPRAEAPKPRARDLAGPPAPPRTPRGPRTPRPDGATFEPADAPDPDRDAAPRPRVPIEPVGRGGILPLPKQAETTVLGSFLYPIWDGLGLAWLVALPPLLAVSALIVFKLIPVTVAGGNMALLGPFAFAFIIVLAFLVAFLMAIWGAVVVASAHGDTHHPGWPELNLGAIFATLIRWGLALAPGCGLMAYLARRFVLGPDAGGAEWVTAAALVGLGGLYSLVALVALYLYDDLLAASPTLVVPALFRFGLPLVRTVAVFTGVLMLGVVVVRRIDRVSDFWPLVFAGWGGCVLLVYLGLVVARLLGRGYAERAEALGWFTRRSRDDDDDEDEDDEDDAPDGSTLPGADL